MSVKNKLKLLWRTYFVGGLEPSKASLSVSLGFLWGVFPILGTCTILCTLTALLLKLNMGLIQAVNYLVYPIQLALLLPCFYLGTMFTGFEIKDTSIETLQSLNFSFATLTALSGEILQIVVNAVVGWVILIPVIAFLIYWVLLTILTLGSEKSSVPDDIL